MVFSSRFLICMLFVAYCYQITTAEDSSSEEESIELEDEPVVEIVKRQAAPAPTGEHQWHHGSGHHGSGHHGSGHHGSGHHGSGHHGSGHRRHHSGSPPQQVRQARQVAPATTATGGSGHHHGGSGHHHGGSGHHHGGSGHHRGGSGHHSGHGSGRRHHGSGHHHSTVQPTSG